MIHPGNPLTVQQPERLRGKLTGSFRHRKTSDIEVVILAFQRIDPSIPRQDRPEDQ